MVKICSTPKPDFGKVEAFLQHSFEDGKLSNFGVLYSHLVEQLKIFLSLPRNKEIVLTSSGTTALMAAYHALHCSNIMMPAYTFEATRCAQHMRGWSSQFSDVDLETACINDINLNTYDRADSVVAVAALSNVPDLKYLSKLCKDNNRHLIIDGAATFGTPGVYSYGDAYCLSFHATKTFGIGEGGAVICSKSLARKVKQFINFGFDNKKESLGEGINGKLSEYTCAIGLSILPKMHNNIALRWLNADIYRKRLSDFVLRENFKGTTYQTFPIFLPDKKIAIRVKEALAKQKIECLSYYRPLHDSKKHYPNSWSLFGRNICLPVHQDVTSDEINRICDIVLSNI